jgi:hypothetical protein
MSSDVKAGKVKAGANVWLLMTVCLTGALTLLATALAAAWGA